MFKNKLIKLFLMLGVILFSLIGVVGCSHPSNNESVNATYIATFFEDDEIVEKICVVDNHPDIINLLKNDTPEKYNDSFFEAKSLLVFKIVESSSGNKSEIESYTITDKILNVYVKTKQYGDVCEEGHWWFLLELKKDEINNFDNVKIFKDDKEIVNVTDIHLHNEAIQCYFEKYIKVKRPNSSIEDVWLFQNLGIYNHSFVGVFLDRKDCDFPEEVLSIEVNGLVFTYSYGYDIIVYSNKEFYSLDDAFERDYLTSLNIKKIYNKYYKLC